MMQKKKRVEIWLLGLLLGTVFFTGCAFMKQDAYDKAIEWAEKGDYEQAAFYFESALREDGTDPEYFIGSGMAFNHLLKYEEAEKIFSQGLSSEIESSNGEKKQLFYGRMVSFYGQSKYENAIQDAEAALSYQEYEDLNRNIRYMEAISYFMNGEGEMAARICDTMLSEDTSDMEAYLLYGGIKTASGDVTGAAGIYEQAIRQDNTYYDAYFALYDAYLLTGQSAAASELLDTLTSMELKTEEQMLAAGRAWYEKEEYDQALVFFERAYEAKNEKGLFYRALVKKKKGQEAEAEKDFLTYLSEEKEELLPEVYNQLAGIYMNRDQYTEAQNMLSSGLAMGDTRAAQNLLRNQVILYEMQGNYEQAWNTAKEYRKMYVVDKDMKKEMQFIKTRK